MTTDLTRADARVVLAWLGVSPPEPSRAWLDSLLTAYGQHVPWESASRIVRRASRATAAACVNGPTEFWRSARMHGTGGTCFESNAALAALLQSVGIPVTLTINDRPPLPACHTALLVVDGDDRLVADAGFPLYGAVPLPHGNETREVPTRWGTFSARRSNAGPGRFVIEQRPHARPAAFELVDVPVSAEAYAAATRADYGPQGLFLDRVVLKKIVGGDVWRFNSGEAPWVLERFRDGARDTRPLATTADAAARQLSRHFGLDVAILTDALRLVTRAVSKGTPA